VRVICWIALFCSFALALVLSGLATIPLQKASGKENGGEAVVRRAISNSAAMYLPPTISLARPTNNASFICGSTITINANAGDSDGTVVKVEFFQGAVKLGEDTTAPYSYDWTDVPAADYVLTAKATDNTGEITTSTAVNISVLAQVKQYVGWLSITNGTDLGGGSVRKTSTGAWDFYASSLQTILPGDAYFESTAANFNQSISLVGADGNSRGIVVGSGGWVGIYENGQEVAATCCHIPSEIISPHAAGDRYRIEITNSVLRYVRYRGAAREVMFTSAAALPAYPVSGALGMSPQNAEWQKTVVAQLNRKVTWSAIVSGIDLGNGSVRKTSTGTWDFSASAKQTLLRGDGYFESTASYWNHSMNVGGSNGASGSLIVGTGGWAAIYENGQEVADTSPIGNISPHAAGDRYRIEIDNGALRYVRYRSGVRTVIYTSANPLPAYPLSFSLGASFQNSEWQNTVIAQLSQTVSWSYINNGIDLSNGSVRKTSTGTWDFSAGPKQQLVQGSGYFESTASYWNHSINIGGSNGAGGGLVAGTGGWAAIYENGQEVANTSPMGNITPHAAGDRYRMEISRGKLRYVRYRSGARSIMFTSNNVLPPYAMGYSLGMSFQNSEWQNTIFSDNVPEFNDASFVSQTVPATMVPGQNYSVTVTMRNTGASTWTPDGDYQLGSENLPDSTRWGLNRVNLTTTVRPGSDATFNFTVTAPAAGSHSFQWRMVQQGVERFGAMSTNVNVQTVNNPPTVSLTSPANNSTFTAPATVALAANASDSDGAITKVEFFQGSTKLGEDTTSPYTFSWTSVSAGTYVLTAKATDNGGSIATSNLVNITVNPPNVPPSVSITAPANNATFANDTNIQISAGASDSDGIVNKVEFFRGATKLGEDTNGSDGFSFIWANVQSGSYSLTVKATDNAGAVTTSSAVNITVSLPAVSIAATDASAAEPGSDTGVFTVSRTGGTSQALTVNFSVSGTAAAGTDYTSIGTTTTIPSGAASRTIVVTPIDNTAVEGDETVIVTLSSNAAYALGTPASATVTIADNDFLPVVSLTSPAGGAGFPTGGDISFTASASEQNGTISKVEFFQGTTKLGEDTNGADGFSFNWTNAPDGNYSLTARATDSYGVAVTSAPVQINVVNFNLARLDPMNRTGGSGEDPLSRNFNWSVGLVGLSGRAGLDLSLSLTYNSLVWTRSGSYVAFDNDRGFPGPGFRLGFPVIQPAYHNSEVDKQAFLLIAPDGSRSELRQVDSSTLYEAADSSHLLFNTANLVLRTTDGTQLQFAPMGSDYQCTEIKDRNGNFITITYTELGRINTVIDTLGREITFDYDGDYLMSITQLWNGKPHYWARFEYYEASEIHTDFQGLTVLGPQNGSTIRTLSKVTLDDDSRFEFDYTYWGQIWKIRNYAADGHLLNYRAYNLPGNWLTPQTDCPRFTERHDWAENWNRDGANQPSGLPAGTEREVLTGSWTVTPGASWTLPDGTPQNGTLAQVTAADGTYNKIYFEGTAGTVNGWKRGLASLVETFDSGNVRQRQSVTLFTQDNTAVPYPLNPRVTETNVYDPAGNRARTTIAYETVTIGDGTNCKLPSDLIEFQANATTPLRRSHTTYNSTSPYTSSRIIGLASEKTLYQVDPNNPSVESLMSMVGFSYDESGSILGKDAPVQHDTAYDQGSAIVRANLTTVKRFNVNNTSLFTSSTIKYNTAGAPVASTIVMSTSPLVEHTTSAVYEDNFSDGNNDRGTFAYPTTVTDPDGFSSTTRYNFDFGAVTRTEKPPPAGQTVGAIKNFTYDAMGRLEQEATELNGNTDFRHTRFEYRDSQIRVDRYVTVEDGKGEAHSFSISDGHGRAFAAASDHPGSIGGFSGQLTLYDNLGRAVKTSAPTETGAASDTPAEWTAAGEDATVGWVYTHQAFDWKGRPTVTTNDADTTSRTVSYVGCGCAGGEVTTVTDEVGKRQRTTADVLGRTYMVEDLNADGSVYRTTTNTHNARDQITQSVEQVGSSGTAQTTTTEYDSYGRVWKSRLPQATAPTVFEYNADDSLHVRTDARGATATYTYNNRGLTTGVTYALSTDVWNVGFDYDAAGNRTSMTDGMGSVTYNYDTLSRPTSETRTFSETGRSFTSTYAYNLADELTLVTDHFGSAVTYTRDRAGQVTDIPTYTTGIKYRAWGGIREQTLTNGRVVSINYDARMRLTQFNVPGVTGWQYQYNGDGALQFSSNLQTLGTRDERLDRKLAYDQVGRLSQGLSGSQARGETTFPPTGPYRQNYGHDVWDHLTFRDNLRGNTYTNYSAPYVDNRNQNTGWQYDANGALTRTQEGSATTQYTYDCAAHLTSAVMNNGTSTTTILSGYDGDGQRVKKIETNVPTTYYVRSSALGGQVLDEVDASGNKLRGYVYQEGRIIAKQEGGQTQWDVRDPAGNSNFMLDASGASVSHVELDPLGSAVDPNNISFSQNPMGFYGGPSLQGTYCRVNNIGISVPCSLAEMLNGHNFGATATINGDTMPLRMAMAMAEIGYMGITQRDIVFGNPWDLNNTVSRLTFREDPQVKSGVVVWAPPARDFFFNWEAFHAGYLWIPGHRSRHDLGYTPPGEFIRLPQASVDLKDLSSLITGARDVIANASDACAKLLGKDALAQFDRISKNIRFEANLLVTTVSPFGDELRDTSWSQAGNISAMTSGEDIYLNPEGWAFIKPGTRGGQPFHPLTSYFNKLGVTQQQYAFAAIIHEFLHAIGKFKPDATLKSDGAEWKAEYGKSVKYQEEVLKKCFSGKK